MDVDRKEKEDLLWANKQAGADQRRPSGRKETERGVGDTHDGPPDGGLRAYSVVIASFVTNGLIFGVINSYSLVYTELLKRLASQGVEGADVKASLCGVLTIGCTFAMSPVSGILASYFGLRTTAVVGGLVAGTGMALSSFVVDHIDALCFTYGILFGLGASLTYTPSLAVLGHYFNKYLGIVNGVVTIGSSVFTVILPPIMDTTIQKYSLEGTFRLMSIPVFGLALCGLMFKPLTQSQKPVTASKDYKSTLRQIVGVDLWKMQRYRLWALLMPVALFGYFVPYIHIRKHIEDLDFKDINMNLPLQCLAATSAIGRIVFGFLADRPSINKIMVQQISLFVTGVLTIILAFAKAFWLIVVIALGMGLCEGGFITLLGPVAFSLCGRAHATQGIGCMLGLAAYPLCFGPPLAALLYSYTKSYVWPFVIAGAMPMIGTVLMNFIHIQKPEKVSRDPSTDKNANGHAISLEHA